MPVGVFLFVVVGIALAAAHFQSASASFVGNTGNLQVSFKEVGLGNGSVTYNLTADGTANYACINNGGKNPKASNKQSVNGPVSATGTFKSDKNGSISGSLTLTPPPAPAGYSCSPGQSQTLVSVTYTNVTLTDTTNTDAPPMSSGAIHERSSFFPD